MHSTIATEKQEEAFLTPPKGKRKIVLATNIAETGITIPDITCVVDCGKHKEIYFDEKRQISQLKENFVSRANAAQRRGRAGRVQSGVCFHLFTKERHDEKMEENQKPEMLRLSLQDLVLRVASCRIGAIEDVILQALDPPSSENIQRAVTSLIQVDALDEKQNLTKLGTHLSRLPLDVYLGKLLIMSVMFRCLDAGLTIAAICSSKSIFYSPLGLENEAQTAKLLFKKGDSDFLTMCNAYYKWRNLCQTNSKGESEYVRKTFLNTKNLISVEELRHQFMNLLIEMKLVDISQQDARDIQRCRFHGPKSEFFRIPPEYDRFSRDASVIDACVAASFYPKLIQVDGKSGQYHTLNNQPVFVHPGSVNSSVGGKPQFAQGGVTRWMAYHSLHKGNRLMAAECCTVDITSVVALCGDTDIKGLSGIINMDSGRIRLRLQHPLSSISLRIMRSKTREMFEKLLGETRSSWDSKEEEWFETIINFIQNHSAHFRQHQSLLTL